MSAEISAPSREARWIAPAWYAALAAATIGFLTYNLRLYQADLTVPLCPLQNDSVTLLSLVTAIHESGDPCVVDRLGAPGTAERMDYPLPEHAHYLAIRGLLALTNHPFLAFNLWCLASYPVTALCTFAVFRAVGVSRLIGFALALIYTFLPFHTGRAFSHTMLAYYHTVPLVLLPALWILTGRLPFFSPQDADGRRHFSVFNATTAWTVLLAGIVAVTSPYYSFFGCFFLVVAGLYRGLSDGSARPLLAGLGTAAVLTSVGFACTLPFVIFKREHGDNPAVAHRHPNEADVYALRVTELVLPFGDHRVRPVAHLTRLYNAESLHVGENHDAVLGTFGTVGFFLLLGRLLTARGGPTLLGGLAVLNAAALVLACSGGLGGLFNYLVFPQIRCYNRVCVFIAFWSLLTIGLLVDRWAATRSRRTCLIAAAIAVLGLLDVTSEHQGPRHAAVQARHQAWAGFVNRMEEALPPGGMVFQLPAVTYPEAGPTHGLPDYAHLACHAYSKTLRWSYGTNRNRRWDCWQQHVAGLPTAEMIRALCVADFAGVYVDRRGYADHGEAIVAELRSLLGPELTASDSGDQLLFGVSGAAQRLRPSIGDAEWDYDRWRLMNRPCVLCTDGFLRRSVSNPPEPWRATHAAVVRIVNPADVPRRLTLTMTWKRVGPGEKDVAISGPGTERTLSVPRDRESFSLDLDVPPGEHVLRFDTTPKPFGPDRMHEAWEATDVRLVERDGGLP